MTSTKREYLEKLLRNTINELVIIKPIPYFIKEIDERSKKCPDCNFNYSEIPIDKGKYLGDNEPDFKNFYKNHSLINPILLNRIIVLIFCTKITNSCFFINL